MFKTLVLGAAGPLGSAVVRRLLEAGLPVVAADRTLDGAPPDLAVGHTPPGDARTLGQAMSGCAVAFVVAERLASPGERVEEALQREVAWIRGVLAAARAARVSRLLWLGPAVTLGRPQGRAATEQDAHLPGDSPYALPDVALAVEWEVLAANSLALTTSTLLTTALLAPPPLGLGRVIEALSRGALPAVPRGALPVLDLRDLTRACHYAVQRARPGQRYALSGATITVAELVAEVCRVTGASPPRLELPIDLPEPLVRAADALPLPAHDALALLELQVALTTLPESVDTAKAELELAFEARNSLIGVADLAAALRPR